MTKTIDLSRHTSIGIGPIAQVKIIENVGDCGDEFIIGRGNNLLISPTPPRLAMLGDCYDYIEIKNNILVVGAATSSGKLLTFCKKHDIAGFELLAKLPGNIGGLVKMNAGLKEWEIFENLICLTTNRGTFHKKQISHAYRSTNIDGVILEVCFEIKNGFDQKMMDFFIKLRDNQPGEKSAGSCFKNPPNAFAGKLIEEAGLKGFQKGQMAFSAKHANFLVNLGGGTFEDAIWLIEHAKNTIKEKFGVDLELEIKLI